MVFPSVIRNFAARMKTVIVQHDIREDHLEQNLQNLALLLNQQPEADLYVLAETFATGFMKQGAHADGLPVLAWMQRQAQQLNAAIAGSVAITDEEGLMRNRLFFVRPDGTYDYYDKRHLFGYAGETDVCYDLRFPVFSRNQGDYDAIIYVANWPDKRRDVWQTLLKARALENQCFVLGVNRVGTDSACEYQGDSVVIDAYGRTIAACTPGQIEVAVAELDMQQQLRFRQKFPVLADADTFILK